MYEREHSYTERTKLSGRLSLPLRGRLDDVEDHVARRRHVRVRGAEAPRPARRHGPGARVARGLARDVDGRGRDGDRPRRAARGREQRVVRQAQGELRRRRPQRQRVRQRERERERRLHRSVEAQLPQRGLLGVHEVGLGVVVHFIEIPNTTGGRDGVEHVAHAPRLLVGLAREEQRRGGDGRFRLDALEPVVQ